MHFASQHQVNISVSIDKHVLKGFTTPDKHLSLPSMHTLTEPFGVRVQTYFPRQRVIRQTPLADWNGESINSRWYHWEKMEHNVENAPCMAPTGCHNQERQQTLSMQCSREAECMSYTVHSSGTKTAVGLRSYSLKITTCVL